MFYSWYAKFGHATATDYSARMARYGLSARDEAFKLVKEHNHKLDPWCMRDLCEFLVYSQKEFWDTVDKHYYNRLFQEGQFRTLDSEVIISEMNSGQERNINTVIHFVLLTTT